MAKEFRELGSKSAKIFVGRVIGQFLSLVSVVVIGRLIGAETYGQFVYIISLLSLISILPNMGMTNGLVSFISRNTLNNHEKKSLLSFCVLAAVIISIVIFGVSYIFNDFVMVNFLNGVTSSELFFVLLPFILIDVLNQFLKSTLRGLRKTTQTTFVEFVFQPLVKTALIVIIVVLLGINNYYSLIIPLYVSSILTMAYFIKELRKCDLIGKIDWEFDNMQILLFSLPLLFTGIISRVMLNVDKYMIGYLIGAANVGVYKVAVRIGSISKISLLSVNTIFAPIISSLYHDNRLGDLKKMYKMTTKWITIINLLIFGGIVVFAENIMHVVGEEFIVGSTALILVSLGLVINSIVGSVGYINTMTGHPRFNLVSSGVAMVVNVILNILLIKPLGINGAAIATAVSLTIQNVLNFIFVYITLKMHPYDKSFIILIGSTILSITVFLFITSKIEMHYILEFLIFGAMYSVTFVGLVYKFVLNKDELDMIKKEFSKVINKSK